jgi:hypothetical protein
MFRSRLVATLLLLLFSLPTGAKDKSPQVITWPSTGEPILKFTFGKLRRTASYGKRQSYEMEVSAQNLWSQAIPSAAFSLYVFDKTRTRIGDGYMSLSNVKAGELIKFHVNFETVGSPESMALEARDLPPELQAHAPPKAVSVTVYSVPSGAMLVVDGKEAGPTPRAITLQTGHHMLEFQLAGYNRGRFPLQITANQVSGGTVTYELGAAARDTVELRDGTVLSGDVESVTANEVTVRVGGQVQMLQRNIVKRILLAEREPVSE